SSRQQLTLRLLDGTYLISTNSNCRVKCGSGLLILTTKQRSTKLMRFCRGSQRLSNLSTHSTLATTGLTFAPLSTTTCTLPPFSHRLRAARRQFSVGATYPINTAGLGQRTTVKRRLRLIAASQTYRLCAQIGAPGH